MKTEQITYTSNQNKSSTKIEFDIKPDLILAFASPSFFESKDLIDVLCEEFSKVNIIGCSTAGEIQDNSVNEETLVLTAVEFESTIVKSRAIVVDKIEESYQKGLELGNSFDKEGLKHIFLLSAGLVINGEGLVDGLRKSLPENVKVTGGLAGSRMGRNRSSF